MMMWLFLRLGSAAVVAPTVPGLEYTINTNLLHYTMPINRLHYTVEDDDG